MLRRAMIIGLSALSASALAQTADAPLSTMIDAEEGEYIVDGNGMSLYLFKADRQGSRGIDPESACNDTACVGTWPPLIAAAPVADAKVDASMLGTFVRKDGTTQVTYNGWPLYYYYEDGKPGDILGDDIESFGDDWYLVGPNGERARN
jgi:predicted lipoprotein with Yx(FWY)xxD motif